MKKKLLARFARLDHDQVYFGLSEPVAPDALAAGAVVFGDPALKDTLPQGALYVDLDCDLAAGRYKWTGSAFEPLPPQQQKAELGAPTLEQAFADFLDVSGTPLPARTAAWREGLRRTMDEQLKGKR